MYRKDNRYKLIKNNNIKKIYAYTKKSILKRKETENV